MITDERIASFINSFNSDYDDTVTAIRKEAEDGGVPIIRKEAGEFIKLLLMIKKPKRILEIGTAVGFSAIFMSRFLVDGGHITTIENYEKRIVAARKNIKMAGAEDAITLLEGDANDILDELSGSYDMIFMDAAKGQYGSFFEKSVRLLEKDGILLCDNVLQDGDVLESRYAVTRRNRTIHSRMRAYLYDIKHHPELETAILNIGDGMSLSIRK
ncbi:MAG: O-methyltransferase [Coprococcus sp.]|nr:O-methyltransferase [Coprococcus sp.]